MISIVICTYNRAPLLIGLLTSLNEQKTDLSLAAEILVVDNNSNDNTRQVVETFAESSRFPVRYFFEGRQGVAYARNAGIRAAKGEIVAYLDDDVKADPSWLQSLFYAFQKTQADVIGGNVGLDQDFNKPVWWSHRLSSALVGQDFGSELKEMRPGDHYFITANIGFRRELFEKDGFFLENLGRRGSLLIGGEDREMFERLLARGRRIFYAPEVKVLHRVEEDKLTPEYMKRWFFDTGRTLGHTMRVTPVQRLFVMPVWAWLEFFAAFCKRLTLFFQNEPERFYRILWLRYQQGVLRERFVHSLPSRWAKSFCVFKEK